LILAEVLLGMSSQMVILLIERWASWWSWDSGDSDMVHHRSSQSAPWCQRVRHIKAKDALRSSNWRQVEAVVGWC